MVLVFRVKMVLAADAGLCSVRESLSVAVLGPKSPKTPGKYSSANRAAPRSLWHVEIRVCHVLEGLGMCSGV